MALNGTAFAELTAQSLAGLYAIGAADPRVVVEEVASRIANYPDRAVFISTAPERAKAEASASATRYSARRPRGPLDGVPVAWKDLFNMAGRVTTAGSAVYRQAPPATADAPTVARLAAAGMVNVGKTNLTEFAYSGLGLNPHFGTPRNPHGGEAARVPGGSSSGSAVAVAAGLVPVAIGTDTAGSVRVPAAFNGIVGFKASAGRIDKSGIFPLSETLDSVGVLARSVADCALVDAALRGRVASAVVATDVSQLRFVVAENIVFDAIEPEVGARIRAAAKAIAERGALVDWRQFPSFDGAARVTREHGTITAVEAYRFHRELVEGPRAGEIDPRVTSRIMMGKRMTALDLLEIQTARRRLRQQIVEELDGALLLMPTVAHVAPEIAPLEADTQRFADINLRTLRNTMLGNFLDLCGVSLPVGKDSAGLPIGLLVSAPGGEDERLLAAGLALEPVLAEAFP